MFKIPFGWLPGSWGLKGKTRSRAQAEYELEGEDLERKLIEIEYDSDTKSFKSENIKLDLKYGKIDQYEHDIQLCFGDKARELSVQLLHGKIDKYSHDVELAKAFYEDGSVELKTKLLDIDLENEKISKHEHNKAVATLNNLPFVGIVNTDYDHKLDVNGLFMELDWNDQFVKMLLEHGYTGLTDELIVNKWFDAICSSITDEDEVQNSFVMDSPSSSSHVKIFRREDGKTEVS